MTPKIDLNYFKTKLEAERTALENDLSKIARRNPHNPADWEIKPDSPDVKSEFRDEVADQLEEFDEKAGVEITLENQLKNIKEALAKIADGRYGLCDVCGKEIELDRLEANPAAETCKRHMAQQGS